MKRRCSRCSIAWRNLRRCRATCSRPISPLSPIGEIFRYRLKGPPNYSVLDLKTLQDWVLQRRFRAVPGVIDVVGWGGKTKTYELQVDFNKLVANGLTLPQVLQAVSNSNINVGGNTVNIGPQSAVVRGVGLIRSIDDLSNTMVVAERRQSGAGQGHRDRDRRREAAARHRRHGRGRRHRPGHRADAPRRAVLADDRARRKAGQPDQQFLDPAAGREDRAHLRPQGPDRPHHPHRAAQHGGRHLPDRAAAMGLPRRPPQRADRRRHHSVRAVLRRDHPGDARRIPPICCRSARSTSA